MYNVEMLSDENIVLLFIFKICFHLNFISNLLALFCRQPYIYIYIYIQFNHPGQSFALVKCISTQCPSERP